MKFHTKIISGNGIGNKIGFPTLNFEIPADLWESEPGVYAGKVDGIPAAIFFGMRETFDEEPSFEAHLVDWEGDWEKDSAEIEIGKHLREARKFDTPEDLAAQIEIDCEAVREG